jgi:hypothetical protein
MTIPDVVEVQLPGGPPGPPGPPGPAGPSGGTLTDLTDVAGTTGTGKAPVDDGTGTYQLTPVTTTNDLNNILAQVAAVEWHYLQPLNGFQNYVDVYGGDWVKLRYRHTLNNIVHLEGMLTRNPPIEEAEEPIVLAVMPEVSRSGYSLVFAATCTEDVLGRIDLQPDGSLVLTSQAASPISWLSLCGISWSVEGDNVVLAQALNR